MTKLYLFVRRYLAVVMVLGAMSAFAQQSVSGKITSDDDGSGIPGVNILEKGTTNGTVSDADGNYRINVGANATLVFSFVGYVSQEVAVGSQSSVNVTMKSDVTSLSEVVVVGYGSQEKRDVTGATISLKSTDFNGGVISSPEQLIQGRAAGVQITSASGEPGAGVNIRIRGTSSVRSGNNPLFVVDGVPLSGDDVSPATNGTPFGDSPAKNPLNFINPNDIASIDVLKDASATAIYGSRGANGVVLITTKSGKAGKPILEYNYNVGFSTITKKYDLLGPSEFLDAYTKFNGAASAATLNKGSSTDWQNQVLRTAITQSHNFAYGAADKSGDYRFSFGTMSQEGIIKKSDLNRYTARFNGSKKFINDKLKIATQMTLSSTKDGNVPISNNGGFEGDLFGTAIKSNPTAPVFNPDGTLYQPSNVEPNPVAYLELTKSYTNTLRALGNISAELQLAKGLSFKTVVGFDNSFSSRKTALSSDLNATTGGIFGVGRLYLNDIQVENKLWENYFTYDTKIGSELKLTALLGYSYQSFGYSTTAFQFANFQTNDLDIMINNYSAAKTSVGTNSTNRTDELQSYYGRANFSYKDKYLLTATLRTDGSTRFGGNNKYGYFPSAAFKWRLSDEAFVPEAISDLSFRVGYGITGNQEIPHNLYQERQRYNDYGIDGGGNINNGQINTVAFPNPNLKWESTSQFNIGIDYGVLGNRLRGSIDYYNKDTKDLLIQVTSAQPAVQPFVWKNLNADVINKGIEFTLEADPIQNSDFKWTVVANAAFNTNTVENFGGLINTGGINGQGLSGAFAERIAGGQPLFAYFLRDFGGYDANGITIYNGGDVQKFIGKSPLPKTTVGLTNNIRYKAFDLSLFFSGQFGQYVYSNTANAYFTAGSLANGRNVTKDVVGNGEASLNAPDVSTRFLYDASFIRLQNLSVGYNVKTSLSFISSLRVTLTGQNLFTITQYPGQDPEVNTNKALNGVPSAGIDYGAYPRARTFTLGISATF
jgi:TonB-dependent starch-binding outer membrane protein SusC